MDMEFLQSRVAQVEKSWKFQAGGETTAVNPPRNRKFWGVEGLTGKTLYGGYGYFWNHTQFLVI